eukprot:TRINITY_DN1136_c0_g2_i1.p1 TRINITY_DN1136_c0_g2~~TRINITY_DN1136_c0_g2_i1.p1  ORF type:complete len:199 (+),score=76.62 TRINITY_DN1136_c0_g2_i1:642-1238(+)
MSASVSLQSSDDVIIQTTRAVADHCLTLKNMLEDVEDMDDMLIPIPRVKGDTLKKILAYCQYITHKNANTPTTTATATTSTTSKTAAAAATTATATSGGGGGGGSEAVIPKNKFDETYFAVSHDQLVDILLAADYLDIPVLLDSGARAFVRLLKGKNEDDICELFLSRKRPFSDEEIENTRKKYPWAWPTQDYVDADT